MLNLSPRSNNSGNILSTMADSEIGESAKKNRLPRHMSVMESPTHSRKVHQSLFQTVRQCPLKQENRSTEATNLAVNILLYQLQDNISQSQHLNNLRSSLQHRLKVAQAAQNERLIAMLREEFKQLEATI